MNHLARVSSKACETGKGSGETLFRRVGRLARRDRLLQNRTSQSRPFIGTIHGSRERERERDRGAKEPRQDIHGTFQARRSACRASAARSRTATARTRDIPCGAFHFSHGGVLFVVRPYGISAFQTETRSPYRIFQREVCVCKRRPETTASLSLSLSLSRRSPNARGTSRVYSGARLTPFETLEKTGDVSARVLAESFFCWGAVVSWRPASCVRRLMRRRIRVEVCVRARANFLLLLLLLLLLSRREKCRRPRPTAAGV